MTDVANKLNEEWKDAGAKVFALTDYYEAGREHYRAWLQAAFGYDEDTAGSHAGITDTSQMLFVRPAGRAQGSDQAVGRPEGFGRLRRSGQSDRGDRQDGHRVQGQRRDQSVQAAEESAAARRAGPIGRSSLNRGGHVRALYGVCAAARYSSRATRLRN